MKGLFSKSWVAGVCAAAAVALAPALATAQTLSAADAAPFMGTWEIVLDTPQGAMPMNVVVKDVDGKVAGEVGSDMMGVQPVTDVTKAESSLVLRYTLDMQGNAVPLEIRLIPDGENMKFAFDAAGGQFYLEGPATKK